MLQRLLEQIKIQPVGNKIATGLLTGKTFVLTGTLPSLTRARAKALIKQAGGRVAESVSRITDYVLAGAAPGEKLIQAQTLDVPVIGEKEFLELTKS